MPLIDRSRSFLAVIDVQPAFLDKLALADRAPLVARIAWIIRVARALDIPMLAMAEDLPAEGPPVPAILEALPSGLPIHDKRVFGLAGQPDLLAAARALNRPQAVLVGLETDVCVCHSALGLKDAGFTVAVVTDATGSPGDNHAAGLVRMQGEGIILTNTKGLYYEWARDLETCAALRSLNTAPPPGVTL